jgi:hypothetical protein
MGINKCALAAVPLVVLAIVGCGGGGSGDSTGVAATTETTPTLSKEELLAQGDAICAEVNAAVGTVSSTSGSATSQIAQRADLYGGMVGRLKALGTPEDAAGYTDFIAAGEELAQAEADVKLAAERGEEGAVSSAQSSASTALASFQAAAQAYGFKSCGEGPSAPSVVSSSEEGSEEESSEAGEEEAAPEEAEAAPETGGAGTGEEGGGAGAGGGTESSGGGSSSGGIGPG